VQAVDEGRVGGDVVPDERRDLVRDCVRGRHGLDVTVPVHAKPVCKGWSWLPACVR
jgi:hypothetical protein